MKLVLAKWTADRVAAGVPPDESSRDAITYLHSRLNGHGGMIVVDAQGRYGIAHNTPRMAWALRDKFAPSRRHRNLLTPNLNAIHFLLILLTFRPR